MAKFNAVEKRCNRAAELLNKSKDLEITKDKALAESIQIECAKETNEINNMIDALREAQRNLSLAWNKSDEYAKVNIRS